jgi:hypothetical protein
MAEPSRTQGTGVKKRPALRGPAAARRAREHLEELTGRPVESVSGLSRTREGWDVVLEIVELERVPPTTDVLASYVVGLDEDGELIGYERVNRYYRNQASE